ncbi:MAG TPA: ferredoxin [Nocardioidaceae bacterium]|jgi:ferredoxin|nr:ferredoxin [Nocardioidaceae bacterium]
MRVIVDRALCDDHGQCEIAAPNVFRIGVDGKLEYDERPDPSERDAIEEAADACPLQAILVQE